MINQLVKKYLEYRLKEFEFAAAKPIETQDKQLKKILKQGRGSSFLKSRGLNETVNYQQFTKSVAINTYEDIHDEIEHMMRTNHGSLLDHKVNYFAKSSGTTSGKSKYLPLTRSYLFNNHIRASWYAAALVYKHNPQAKIFKYKNLLMGGSIEAYDKNPRTLIGDISGFTISNIPAIGRPFYTPDFKTALISDWDIKLDRMVEVCAKEQVFLFAGVPTWTLVLFEKLLEKHRAPSILDIWPEAQVYMHGGINFDPYRQQFEEYLPNPDFHYMEVYNASEGCFGIQYEKHQQGMMLLLNNEVFYEFVTVDKLDQVKTHAIPLEAVDTDTNYAIVISNTSGLYRYLIGDVVRFNSLNPYIISFVGRTKEFLNAFGEELIIENAEHALKNTCIKMQAQIANYSVAPVYIKHQQKGRHQWLVEFRKRPDNMKEFARILDIELKNLNSDYEAKRYNNIALEDLEIVDLPSGTFENWLRSKGKFGNQNKVPRLKNDRVIAEEILAIL